MGRGGGTEGGAREFQIWKGGGSGGGGGPTKNAKIKKGGLLFGTGK